MRKDERGSVTLIVLATVLTIIIILFSYLTSISLKRKSQIVETMELQNVYAIDTDQAYEERLKSERIKITNIKGKSNPESTAEKTTVYDDNNVAVQLPAGFKIASDSATTVAGGIVIEDASGNQFVWIPVGKGIKKSATETVDIELGRYSFDSDGNATAITTTNTAPSFIEETATQHSQSGYWNTIAKDIDKFKQSVGENGGYYLARYEAGVTGDTTLDTTSWSNDTAPNTNWTGYTNGKLAIKSNQQVWNYITQNKAAEIARNMYPETNKNITSDLVNSYAWDTAIVYIEKCGTNINYANKARLQSSLVNTGMATDGINKDVQCNIYDMAGNTFEWSTESCNNGLCSDRGGDYSYSNSYTAFRGYAGNSIALDYVGFRVSLYL